MTSPTTSRSMWPSASRFRFATSSTTSGRAKTGSARPGRTRRLAYAFHVATDRYQLIDAVYLGSAKVSRDRSGAMVQPGLDGPAGRAGHVPRLPGGPRCRHQAGARSDERGGRRAGQPDVLLDHARCLGADLSGDHRDGARDVRAGARRRAVDGHPALHRDPAATARRHAPGARRRPGRTRRRTSTRPASGTSRTWRARVQTSRSTTTHPPKR